MKMIMGGHSLFRIIPILAQLVYGFQTEALKRLLVTRLKYMEVELRWLLQPRNSKSLTTSGESLQ